MARRGTTSLIVLTLAGLTASGCQSQPGVEGRWELVTLSTPDREVVAGDADSLGQVAVLDLADGEITGYGGCNTLAGTYEYAEGRLLFGDVWMTLAGCFDISRYVEPALQSLFGGGVEVEFDDDQTMVWVGGETTITLRPTLRGFPRPG